MQTNTPRFWPFALIAVPVFVAVLIAIVPPRAAPSSASFTEEEHEGKAKVRDGGVRPAVVNASSYRPVTVDAVGATGFTPQTRVGYDVGDQWEPAIAADRFGHVYMLYPQYGGVPGCADCYSPTMILQISSDHGSTWSSPRILYPAGRAGGEWDAEVVVDPVDGRTVYTSWLQNGKSDIFVGKSTDFGATWSVVEADHTNAGTDKPILTVRGRDVYVSYNHSQTAFVAASHDGGATFTQYKMNRNAKLGWSLSGGGVVVPNGGVFFAWAGYEQSGGAVGNVNLYISKSSDGGTSWTTRAIEVSKAPPDCAAYACGWAYLGAQVVMTSDAVGNLYALWNSNSVDGSPNRMYFSRSTDGGDTWSTKLDVSTARAGTHHNFPAIAATGTGDVRIAWMDARAAATLGGQDRWNVYYRSSSNGGATWSSEVDLATYVGGSSYIFADGFRYPFGDYFEMDIDEQGTAHAVFGEGDNYDSPGSIWYVKGM